ncbi:MAG TPA: polysaccharide deacetylase family protein [Mycobacteriales bacterium]|nr:polysaccharide deacetylase family protein [Mycobacteriales bacterium]
MSARRLAVLAGSVAIGQVGPAVTWLAPVRLAVWPRLAGIGRPGHLALTFDDGPDPIATPLFLAELDELGWKATFFVLGEQVRRSPRLLDEIAAAGHEIGVHGDEHRYLIARTPRAAADDLRRARDTVGDRFGHPPVWFRPPYGVLSGPALVAARRLGLRPVLWTAWGRDWTRSATPQSVLDELGRGILSGGTAVLHDSDFHSAPGAWRSALGALRPLAEEMSMRHVTVGPIAEHGIGGRRER